MSNYHLTPRHPHRNQSPVHALPALLRNALSDIGAITQAPVGLSLSALLGACAVAVQALYRVRRTDNLVSPCCLFFLSIADSGERKTTVDELVFRPHREFEHKQEELRFQKAEIEKRRLVSWRAELRGMERRLQKETQLGASPERIAGLRTQLEECVQREPKVPTRFQIIHSDVTPPAFLSSLAEGPRSVALIEDEADRFFSNRHGVIHDPGMLNKAWNGMDISAERKGGFSVVTSPRVTLSLMIQSRSFHDYMERKGEAIRGVGFLARCLVCFPESTQGKRFLNGPVGSTEGLDRLHKRISELLEISHAEGECKVEQKQELYFSAEAQSVWNDVFNEVEALIAPGQAFCDATDYASKIAENIARLAAIFHVIQGREGLQIGGEDLRSATTVASWYASEFLRLFSPLSPEDEIVQDVAVLRAWLVKFAEGAKDVEVSYLMQRGPCRTRRKAALTEALRRLYDAYDIDIEFGRTGAPRHIYFRPRLLADVRDRREFI